ncbi:hypothetical protein T06_8020 [Trichinella sp. T6]|nr:hypothetical protein T06_8020 [Trichinella sp. T6]
MTTLTVAEKVDGTSGPPGRTWYLPHHAVYQHNQAFLYSKKNTENGDDLTPLLLQFCQLKALKLLELKMCYKHHV